MLAFGWTIERTKEGEAFGMHTCTARVSQSGQVCVPRLFHVPLLTKCAFSVAKYLICNLTFSSHWSLLVFNSQFVVCSQLSFEGASTFSPKPVDMSSITLSWDQCVSNLFTLFCKSKNCICCTL